MSRKNTIVFDATVDGKDVKLMARTPNLEHQREGMKVYNRAFNDAVKSGAMLRDELTDFMRDRGKWNDEKEAKMKELGSTIINLEKTLAKGGISLSQAKENALKLKELRAEVQNLIAERTDLDVHTAEGQADNERFNYWVSVCLVYNDTQKPVFSSMDDYVSKNTEEYAAEGAGKLAELLYNITDDYQSKLEENKFLREWGFADEKNRLVNKDGHLVDRKGKLINELGQWVDEQGRRVDKWGDLLDDDNNYIFERQPFLDDDGNPIVKEEPKKAEPEVATEEVAAT